MIIVYRLFPPSFIARVLKSMSRTSGRLAADVASSTASVAYLSELVGLAS